MHLRMFEIARDHLHRLNICKVIGGIISPVHDNYGKKGLLPANHRCNMIKAALDSSDWIRLDVWECRSDTWLETQKVLAHHQNYYDSLVNANEIPNKRKKLDLNLIHDEVDRCLPDNFDKSGPIHVKLLCGGDLLESFAVPGLWKDQDVIDIVKHHGLVVITRNGSNPHRFIYESDVLTEYENNIQIVTEWITNEISSTKIRRALHRGQSVKYLLPDPVIDYIKSNDLYGTESKGVADLHAKS